MVAISLVPFQSLQCDHRKPTVLARLCQMPRAAPDPDVSPSELTPTAYLVLGLIRLAGEATPYDLKRMASSLSGLWTLRHDQVYRETERLARSGLLSEEREEHGRR